MKVCSIDGCGREIHARGWCNTHYQRWRKHGDPLSDIAVVVALPGKECLVEGCTRLSRKRGWCVAHYERWRRNGEADDGTPVRDLMGWPGNLLRRLLFLPPGPLPTGCIEFTGALSPDGYGRLNRAGGMRLAHREAYALVRGPIPEGLELDHLCVNPACVHPGHLEPVTHEENLRRARERAA